MKLFHKKRYLKLIPEKFSSIENVTDYLDDPEHKRLTESEREALNRELLSRHLEAYICRQKKDIHLKRFMGKTEPVTVLRIETRSHHYHAIKMANGTELKCPAELYRISPLKETVKRLY